jgi:two-component system, NarL family, nitrate/nitrite response regulator NarL
MHRRLADNEQIASIAQNTRSSVATILTCRNTLIRSGISHTLSGTRFVISEEVPEHSSELVILCLIHADQATDEVTGTVERLKAQWPSARVVLLTDYVELPVMAQAIQSGLDGICSTTMDREPLIKALELVMLGETFIAHAFTSSLLNRASYHQQAGSNLALDLISVPSPAMGTTDKLSGREIQILHCLTQGFSNKHIARVLGLAEATVKVHIKAILRKIQAANRTQAAVWAQEHLKATANNQPMPAAE